MRQLKAPRRGLTLLELMVSVSITGILAMAAAPAFIEYVQNAKLREAGTALLAEALYAQSEAVRRNGEVTLSTRTDSVSVTDASTSPALDRRRTLPWQASAGTQTVVFGSDGHTPSDVSIDVSVPGITCTTSIRCPGLRIDAGGSIRLCSDKTSTTC